MNHQVYFKDSVQVSSPGHFLVSYPLATLGNTSLDSWNILATVPLLAMTAINLRTWAMALSVRYLLL